MISWRCFAMDVFFTNVKLLVVFRVDDDCY